MCDGMKEPGVKARMGAEVVRNGERWAASDEAPEKR